MHHLHLAPAAAAEETGAADRHTCAARHLVQVVRQRGVHVVGVGGALPAAAPQGLPPPPPQGRQRRAVPAVRQPPLRRVDAERLHLVGQLGLQLRLPKRAELKSDWHFGIGTPVKPNAVMVVMCAPPPGTHAARCRCRAHLSAAYMPEHMAVLRAVAVVVLFL